MRGVEQARDGDHLEAFQEGQSLIDWENDRQYRGGVPDSLSTPQKGAFNAWIRLKFVDGGSAVMRIPMPGKTMFPAEKIQREVAVM